MRCAMPMRPAGRVRATTTHFSEPVAPNDSVRRCSWRDTRPGLSLQRTWTCIIKHPYYQPVGAHCQPHGSLGDTAEAGGILLIPPLARMPLAMRTGHGIGAPPGAQGRYNTLAMPCATRDELPPARSLGDVTRLRGDPPGDSTACPMNAGLGHRPNRSIVTCVCARVVHERRFAAAKRAPIARRSSPVSVRGRDGTMRTQATGIINR
jgi:hypothetical protein